MGKEIEEPKVDFNVNALVAPEGTSEENFDLFTNKEPVVTPSTSFSNLPNLDPAPTDITNQTTEDKNPDAKEPDKDTDTIIKDSIKSTNGQDIPWYHKPFKALQKKLELSDDEFKMPEGLTEENYIDKYNELLYENTEFDSATDLHPEIKKLNEIVSKGVDFKEALNTYQRMNNLEALSDKELVSLSLKQKFGKSEQKPDGWDEEKINAQVAKMDSGGMLEVRAEEIRDQIRTEKANLTTRYEEQTKTQRVKEAQEYEKKRNTEIDKAIEYFKGVNDVYGIPVSKAEKLEFNEDFKLLVKPFEKEGKMTTILNELLQSNENLMKVAYMLKKGDSKVREALTRAKEGAKKSVIDRLDDEPALPKKNSSYLNEAAIDLDKLEAPARV
jgi:hypothetical protein